MPLRVRASVDSAPCLASSTRQSTQHEFHLDTSLLPRSGRSQICASRRCCCLPYDGTARLTSLTLTPCCITNQLLFASALWARTPSTRQLTSMSPSIRHPGLRVRDCSGGTEWGSTSTFPSSLCLSAICSAINSSCAARQALTPS